MDFSGFGALGGYQPQPQQQPQQPQTMAQQLMALAQQVNGSGAKTAPQANTGGGVVGGIQRLMNPSAASMPAAPTVPAQPIVGAPPVPGDGSMQATIGPGTAPPAPAAAPPAAPVKMGLPQGGLLGLMQGQSPQGLMGLLQRGLPGAGGSSLAGQMPQAGMLPGGPAAPISQDPVQVPPGGPGLPTDINPMNQF